MTIKLPHGKPRIGDTGRLSESRLAKDLGARLKPASGAMASAKGDMQLPGILIEAKSTVGRSIGLEHAWLAKIATEAQARACTPALMLSFTNGNGQPAPKGSWVVIPLAEWKELQAIKAAYMESEAKS